MIGKCCMFETENYTQAILEKELEEIKELSFDGNHRRVLMRCKKCGALVLVHTAESQGVVCGTENVPVRLLKEYYYSVVDSEEACTLDQQYPAFNLPEYRSHIFVLNIGEDGRRKNIGYCQCAT